MKGQEKDRFGCAELQSRHPDHSSQKKLTGYQEGTPGMRKHVGALGAGIRSYLANTNPLGGLPPLLHPKSHIQTHRAAPPRRRGPVRCEGKAIALTSRREARESGAGRWRRTELRMRGWKSQAFQKPEVPERLPVRIKSATEGAGRSYRESLRCTSLANCSY